jgi:hypothetical protein
MNDHDPQLPRENEPSSTELELLAMALSSTVLRKAESDVEINRDEDKSSLTAQLSLDDEDIIASFFPDGLRASLAHELEHSPTLKVVTSDTDGSVLHTEVQFRTIVYTDNNQIFTDFSYRISRGEDGEYQGKVKMKVSSQNPHLHYEVTAHNDGSKSVQANELHPTDVRDISAQDMTEMHTLATAL